MKQIKGLGTGALLTAGLLFVSQPAFGADPGAPAGGMESGGAAKPSTGMPGSKGSEMKGSKETGGMASSEGTTKPKHHRRRSRRSKHKTGEGAAAVPSTSGGEATGGATGGGTK